MMRNILSLLLLFPLIYGYSTEINLDHNNLLYDECPMHSLLWNGPRAFIPYSSGEYTVISEEQTNICKKLSNSPKWAKDNPKAVKEYYDLHEETLIDRNLCYLASSIMGIIVHGGISQEELASKLNRFNIRKLLENGPEQNSTLSFEAEKLIYESLHEMPRVIDIHLHNFGYDEGNYLNPNIAARKKASYKDYFTFMALRYASGMSLVNGSTHEARKRLHLYAGHFPKLTGFVLPIHQSICQNGEINWNLTGSYLKNHSALLTAICFNNPYHDSELLPAASVHPFDPHWREKLLSAHEKGIRLVKWMPPQSIPPDSPLLDDFYLAMKDLKMTIIAHAGVEHTIPTDENNLEWSDWGNPLRFRKPLQMGVNVILAHCGHNDWIPDLDDPKGTKKPGYELFIRLAREAREKNKTGEWEGILYGDLAAVTTHYGPDFIKELLKVVNEEGFRLIYGSDYPFTNLIQPGSDGYELCAKAGILNPAYVQPLKEIRDWNPLLANYIFTKNLEWKLDNGEVLRFPDATFTGEFKDADLTNLVIISS